MLNDCAADRLAISVCVDLFGLLDCAEPWSVELLAVAVRLVSEILLLRERMLVASIVELLHLRLVLVLDLSLRIRLRLWVVETLTQNNLIIAFILSLSFLFVLSKLSWLVRYLLVLARLHELTLRQTTGYSAWRKFISFVETSCARFLVHFLTKAWLNEAFAVLFVVHFRFQSVMNRAFWWWGLAPQGSCFSLKRISVNLRVVVLLRRMRLSINLRFFIENFSIFAVLRHVLEVSDMILDLWLGMHNVVGLFNFNRFFDSFVVHTCLVLIFWRRHILVVSLVRRAGRGFFMMILMKHNKVFSHHRPPISYLQGQVLNRLLEPMWG